MSGIPVLKVNSSWTQFIPSLRHRTAFTTATGSLRGTPGKPESLGQLGKLWSASAMRASYVVYSYDTPIAWFDLNAWVYPSEHYLNRDGHRSVTTSKHQGRISTALSVLGDVMTYPDFHTAEPARVTGARVPLAGRTRELLTPHAAELRRLADRTEARGEYDALIAETQAAFRYSNGLTH
jgi:hypothetical protein